MSKAVFFPLVTSLNFSQSLFTPFHPIAAIATTPKGIKTLYPLCKTLGATLHVSESSPPLDNTQTYNTSLSNHLREIWGQNRAFIFCLATGAVVRLIAPLLHNKTEDPAIIVLDQEGKFVISLCGGHQGGADLLTQLIADHLDAIPIITGASASLDLPVIDTLGFPYGWSKGSGNWTKVSAAIAAQGKIQVIQEAGSTLWQNHLPEDHPFYFGFSEDPEKMDARVWISATKRQFDPDSNFPKVQWHPRVLWVGIGCTRGTSQELIARAIEQVFQKNHLALEAIAGLATIDIKEDEQGILDYCQEKEYLLTTFSAEKLREIEIPNPSAVVNEEVGTPSVAEAAAILASQFLSNQETVKPSLIVPKQIIKSEDNQAVTLAIAQSELEYTGRTGKLELVGIGPGSLEHITPAAKNAIRKADAIIGYSLYLQQIEPLLNPGQIKESYPLTQERKRAQRGIELAEWGLTVAVISSGDCGIYAMAGLVLEELQAKDWDGKTPEVQIIPGITALQSAASRVGAPLMHDFCAISLSDLLTPWEIIKQRLEAAARGDFITGLYNPKSQTRTEQIIKAQQIFLTYRNPETPVALVRSAYRPDETIVLTTLEKMLEHPIDMMTTVIIGNSRTYYHKNWIITPRSYKIE